MITFDVDSRDRISLPPEYRDELARYRRQSKKLRVMIMPVFEERTLSQNALFHSKLKKIEMLTGMPYEIAKDEIKKMAVDMGYPFKVDQNGELVLDSNGEPVPISSAKASISEMKILIEALYIWCDNNQVEIEC